MNGIVASLAAALALATSALAVTRPNAVHSLMCLVTSLLSLAATFFALGAGLAGVLMVLIYAGAIVVVFVFVVMTLDTSPEVLHLERATMRQTFGTAATIVVCVAAVFGLGLGTMSEAEPVAVVVKQVGLLLFGPWAFAVELASFLLLAGLLGVRHLGWREERKP
jgi:NADH-quinone oxidoreductase subunit J